MYANASLEGINDVRKLPDPPVTLSLRIADMSRENKRVRECARSGREYQGDAKRQRFRERPVVALLPVPSAACRRQIRHG